ncbi:MAG: hypothetical protein ABUK13_05590 [Gammaproteobacteria bacterium]
MNEEQVECPKCNGTLDTGGECNDCDYDAQNAKQNFVDGFSEVKKQGKHKTADFLRKNTYGTA